MFIKKVDKNEKLENPKYFKNIAIWFLSECVGLTIYFIV